MRQVFYPKEYKASAYDIDFARWRKKGYRGIIFDVDNTLVPHGAPADARAKKLFEELHALGFAMTLLSNNGEERVKPFCEAVVGAGYIYKAGKPKRRGYVHAMERMGTDVHTTLFVGDQIFTDVWGANRAGIYTILVKPIHPKEEIQIVLKRYLERIVLYFYFKKEKYPKGMPECQKAGKEESKNAKHFFGMLSETCPRAEANGRYFEKEERR